MFKYAPAFGFMVSVIRFIAALGLIGVLFMVVLCIQRCGRSQQPRREPESHPNEESPSTVQVFSMIGLQYDIESFEAGTHGNLTMTELITQTERKNLIQSKLHYQLVLPDRSNANIQSLRNVETKEDATETVASKDDSDDESTIVSDHVRNQSSTSSNSLYLRVQDLFSLRSLRPQRQDICTICLQAFEPEQTICAAKNKCCNHMFHESCLRPWLMDNDECPLCRSNIMQ